MTVKKGMQEGEKEGCGSGTMKESLAGFEGKK